MLRKIALWIVGIVVVAALTIWIATRPDTAKYGEAQLSGPHPVLAKANAQTIPTIVTADPIGWQKGEAPVPAPGLAVSRFAVGLDHPRTMLVLPNGDVLVAETNSQPRPAKGIKDKIMNIIMTKVGAGGA